MAHGFQLQILKLKQSPVDYHHLINILYIVEEFIIIFQLHFFAQVRSGWSQSVKTAVVEKVFKFFFVQIEFLLRTKICFLIVTCQPHRVRDK
jgi:hypothetical protein